MSIWDFKEIKNTIDGNNNFITLNEGNTPANKLKMNGVELVIKREDKNPTGSWKDRATAYKLTKLLSEDIHEGVISTSGNAAISYLTYIKTLNLNFKLYVIVKNDVNKSKLKKLQELISNSDNQLYIEENPKRKSVEISAHNKIPNLKSAIDDDAVIAYRSLGFELREFLNKQESNQEAGIFIPASSGTGFVGTTQGVFMKLGNEYLLPRFFVCQTDKVHPFYDTFKNITEDSTTTSLADAIIDTSGLRSPQVIKIVRESNGDILKINNDELTKAKDIMEENSITDLSYNSLLSIAGFLQVVNNHKLKKAICIASGT